MENIRECSLNGCKPGDWIYFFRDRSEKPLEGVYVGYGRFDTPMVVTFKGSQGAYLDMRVMIMNKATSKPRFELIGLHDDTPIVKADGFVWAGCSKLKKSLVEKILANM